MSSNGVWKGCEPINSPDHRHIGELLDILDIFCEWRNESPEKYTLYRGNRLKIWFI